MFVEQLPHPQFMHRVGDRPQETHGHGLNFGGLEFRDDFNRHSFIERRVGCTRAVDSLGHLKSKRARYVGLGIRRDEVKRLDPPAFAQHQNVRVTRCRQESRTRGIAGDDRVDRVGRAVNQHLPPSQQVGQCFSAILRRQ